MHNGSHQEARPAGEVAGQQCSCIIIKTASEISLKSHFVRKYFMNKLCANIKSLLRSQRLSGNRMVKKGGRIFLYPGKAENLERIARALEFVFGIHSVAMAVELGTAEKDEIVEKAAELSVGELKKGDSFAVRANAAECSGLSSHALNEAIGSAILKKMPSLKVDLTTPGKEVFVEVRGKNSWLYFSEKRCHGGLPLGSEGSVAVLFEGCPKELAAAWLMMKRGCSVFPLVKREGKKILAHINKLKHWNLGRKFRLTESKNLNELIEKEDISVQAVVKADAELADFKNADNGVELPIFRPLVFYPKEMLGNVLELVG